jgi:5-methylcytosine-specific restriction endonuclease McrA
VARKPDTPCSSCGRMLWSGTGSRGPEERMCRPCRRGKTERRDCTACGGSFEAIRSESGGFPLTCSEQCRVSAKFKALRERPCVDCGDDSDSVGNPALCIPCSAVRLQARNRRKNVKRRGAAVVGPKLTIRDLGDRDGWRCHLCRRHVDSTLVSPHPRSATFDHLIPVSKGGTDSPVNLALAHRDCNTRRGNRGIVQLLLFG